MTTEWMFCVCVYVSVCARLLLCRGPVPVSCTELVVQVGSLKCTGLSQLVLLAAAAAAAGAQGPSRRAYTSAGGAPAPASATLRPAGALRADRASKPPAVKVLTAVAWLPEKVKVSIAGAQLLPAKPVAQQRSSLLQLPVLTGSLGAVSLAASSCQKPSAAKPGSKLLSLSLAVGQLELAAAGPSGPTEAGSGAGVGGAGTNAGTAGSRSAAAVLTFPGLSGSLTLAKVPAGSASLQSGSRAGSRAGGGSSSSGREGLRLRQRLGSSEQGQQHQQQQQQQSQHCVLKATCTCKLVQQPQLQLHAAHLPPLLTSVQLLQASLKELKAQQQAAASATRSGVSAEDAAADDQLPEATLSPAVSLSSLPRPDTPSLTTPCLSPSPRPPSPADAAAAAAVAADQVTTGQAAGAGSDPAAAAAAGSEDVSGLSRGLASFGSGVLQRLPSKLLFGGGGGQMQDAQLALVAELAIATDAGVSVEVTDAGGDVALWLTVQEVDAGAAAEWPPATSSSSSRWRRQPQQVPADAGTLQLSAHAMLQQLVVSVAPGLENAPDTSSSKSLSSGSAHLPLHKLLLLDSASLQVSSADEAAEDEPTTTTSSSSGPQQQVETAGAAAGQAGGSRQPIPLQVSALAGQVQVAASVSVLQPLLALVEPLYLPVAKQPAAAGSSVLGDPLSAAPTTKGPKKPKKAKRVVLTAVEVQLQSCELSLSHRLSAGSAFATEAAKQAAAAGGMQTRLLLAVSGLQLSVLPLQQQLGASVEQLQVGYTTQCAHAAGPEQSVELLLLKAAHIRQYQLQGLLLLKVAVQQLRSDNHVDVVLGGVEVASAVLQQVLSTAQQLQARHASAAAAATVRQSAAAAVVAAATARDPQAAQQAADVASAAASALDDQGLVRGDSFSALAVQPILDGLKNDGDEDEDEAVAGESQQHQSGSAALPPAAVRLGSSSGSASFLRKQSKQKPLLALEAQLCDVAVQLSVCEQDALLVQMDQLNFSSVLEQAVITKLRFAINGRSIIQVPHAAVHQVPGWLPPGVTAAAVAAAAAAQSDSDGSMPQADPASSMGASASWQDLAGSADAGGAAGAGAMTASLAFLNIPAPCSSLGSRRPAPEADHALYQRQAARQQAGRERCKVPGEQATGSSSEASDRAAGARGGGSSSKSGLSFSHCSSSGRGTTPAAGGGVAQGSAATSTAASAVISLDVFAERVLFSVPHDEAPGRIIVVCETWAKAVKEVR